MAIKMLLFLACNRLLNPYGYVFYGACAEDQVIHALLRTHGGFPKSGYYVDVGCNHPIKYSNTFSFYLMGWRGLTIDANANLIAHHKKVRPIDLSLCSAVSDSEKLIVFTRFSDNTFSSISSEFVKEFQNVLQIVSEEKLKTRTLNSIFIEYNVPKEFELLSIDVEGQDFEVINGINLLEYKPRLITIEMRGICFKNMNSNNIYTYLTEHGYDLIAYYHLNGFFLRRDLNIKTPKK